MSTDVPTPEPQEPLAPQSAADIIAANMAQAPEAPEPTPEATPEPETEPQPEASEELSHTAFMEMLSDVYGYDVRKKYKNDAEAVKGLVEAAKSFGKRLDDAEYGRQYRDNEAAFRQWQQQSQQHPQPQQQQYYPPQQQQPVQNQPVTLDQAELWMQQVTRDPESGELKAVPGATPGVVQQVQEYNRRIKQTAHALAYEPDKFIAPYIAPYLQQIEQKVQSLVEQTSTQSREQAIAENWVKQNSSWMFLDGDENKGYSVEGMDFKNDFVQPLMAQVQIGSKTIPQVLEEARQLQLRARPAVQRPAPPPPPARHQPSLANPAAQGIRPPEPQWEPGDTATSYMMRLARWRDGVA